MRAMSDSLFEQAKALQRAGDFGAAALAYGRAIEADPADFRSHHNLAVTLQELERVEEAERAYEAALAANPDSAWTHYNLARLRHLAGRADEAEPGYRRALALEPELAEAHFNLGRLLLERGDASDAEAALRVLAERDPNDASVQSYLGDSLFAQARLHEALEAYRRTRALQPANPAAAFDEGKALEFLNRVDEAVACYRRAAELDPASTSAREALARALADAGRREEAVASVNEWLAREPGNATARHVLASLGGAETPERASDDYVRETFDRFAGDFDQTLARLGYRAPALLVAALALAVGEPKCDLDVLDAGCGTGLCGPLVRPWARRLEGVDLSARMLEQARRRGGYDALHEAELGAFLAAHERTWDAIVSADTLCYFGTLDDVLAAAACALRPGGRLLFTLERHDGSGDSHLGPHGRYAHAPTYVTGALTRAGFEYTLGRGILRHEGGRAVEGLIVTARLASA